MWPYSSSAVSNQCKTKFCFLIFTNLVLTGFPLFWRPFWTEDMNRLCWFAIPYKVMSWRTKHINLKKIAQKLKTWECRIVKHIKKAVMTSLNQHFQNLRKVSSQIFVKVMWSKFHQNRPRIVEMRGCDRQTDTHTSTHPHIRPDAQTGVPQINIFSPEMTEYKKEQGNTQMYKACFSSSQW